jgi:aromatic ring-opening dioxygenase LigB subunit
MRDSVSQTDTSRMSERGIVFAAIAPHGGIVVPELCSPEELGVAAATRAGMQELGRRFAAARPEAVVVLTPHNVHVDGSIAVVVAGRLEGSMSEAEGRAVALDCPVDLPLSLAYLNALVDAGFDTVGVSFGPSDPEQATMPLDWGALIPLWFMGGRNDPPLPVVLVVPARDLLPRRLVDAGAILADACLGARKPVAVIASADHGHTHDAEGIYGFDPASAVFDELVAGLVRKNRLEELVEVDPGLVEAAKADSWWQLLMLHGALGEAFDVELLSYEAPTYFGMLCAAFTPKAS